MKQMDQRIRVERLQEQWHEKNNKRLQIETARDLVERIQVKFKPFNGTTFTTEAQQLHVYREALDLAVREWRFTHMPFCMTFGNEEWFNASLKLDLQHDQMMVAFTPIFSSLAQGDLNIQILTADAPIVKYALGESLDEDHSTPLLPK